MTPAALAEPRAMVTDHGFDATLDVVLSWLRDHPLEHRHAL